MTRQMMGAEKNIQEGDQVWLSTKPLALEGNPKLLPKWIGPFEVMERLTGACRLRLPSTIHIYPVINLTFLKAFVPPTAEDPPSQIKQVTSQPKENECEVREILDHR